MNTPDPRLPSGGGSDRYLPAAAAEQLPYNFVQWPDDDAAEVDFFSIWSAIYRNRYAILAIIILSLLAGVATVMLIPPTYRAKASIEIEAQSGKVLGTEDSEPNLSGLEMDRFLQTQVDVLTSRALAARVADRLQLYDNENFLRGMGVTPPPGQTAARRRNAVISQLQSNLDVALPKNSRVVDINFESRQPAIAAAVANSYADNFISGNLQRRFDTSTYSRNFLQSQLALTKGRLEQSERALLTYARSAGLLDTSGGANEGSQGSAPRSLTTANLVQLNAAYSSARSQRVQAQQRWQQAQATPLMNLPEVLSNPAISDLTQKRAELEATQQQELQRRKPDHPEMQQAAARLAEMDRQIMAIATSIRDSIQDQYLVARRQEAALESNVGQLKGQTLSEQDRGIRYNILKREVDTNRELYDGLLQRYKELSAAAGVTANNISIVDPAEIPTSPVWPRPVVNMALAGLGGLALALLFVFGREVFDDSVRDPGDVDEKLGLPLLGTVPRIGRRKAPLDELLKPQSALAEAYHTIRAAVELSSGEGAPSTLLVTSSREGEGKTTSALALAFDFASAGRSVLLIDADLRRPSLHSVLGLTNSVGLSNLLAQHRNVDEVVQATHREGLHFVAAGPLPPSPALLLARKHFANLLISLRNRFDQIIIDSPPVLGLADATQLSAVADGTIFVIEANRAHHGQAKMALRRLVSARANLVGAILTKFDPRKLGYGYNYGYYGQGSIPSGSEPQMLDSEMSR